MANLSDIYKVYIQWLSLPKKDRKFKTTAEFCDYYKITPIQLLEFQDSGSFDSDLKAESVKWVKRQLPDLLHTLVERYKITKQPADARLLLETADILRKDSDNLSPQTNIFNIFQITDEQKQQIFERARRRTLTGSSGIKE